MGHADRRDVAIRALHMLARRLDCRAQILEIASSNGFSQAVFELRNIARQYRRAAAGMAGMKSRPIGEREGVVKHRVYMRFERAMGVWRVSFRAESGLLRDLSFGDRDKVWKVAERAGALTDLAAKQGFEAGLRQGAGGIQLLLSDDQLARLRR